MKSTMKTFGGVTTARQDGWVKVMMTTDRLSVVKSTIFIVLALIVQKSNIMILILKTICFFAKNVNLADRCINIYIVKL